MQIKLDINTKFKTWIAKINGTSQTYGLDREFVEGEKEMKAKSWGYAHYDLTDGLYEICNKDDREFVLIADGQKKEVSKKEAIEIAETL